MKLLDEIREQPLHIRKFFMWTSVIIVFAVFGLWYFRSAKDNAVALLSSGRGTTAGEKETEDRTASPFAAIKDSWQSMRANISDLVGSSRKSEDVPPAQTSLPTPAPVKLPVQ